MSENLDKKTSLHPRNKHQGLYDFDALVEALKEIAEPFKIENTNVSHR